MTTNRVLLSDITGEKNAKCRRIGRLKELHTMKDVLHSV